MGDTSNMSKKEKLSQAIDRLSDLIAKVASQAEATTEITRKLEYLQNETSRLQTALYKAESTANEARARVAKAESAASKAEKALANAIGIQSVDIDALVKRLFEARNMSEPWSVHPITIHVKENRFIVGLDGVEATAESVIAALLMLPEAYRDELERIQCLSDIRRKALGE